MFEKDFTEFVWRVFDDENPEYDRLLLETYGMLSRDEPKNVVECHVIDSIEKAFSGTDKSDLPSVSKSIYYYMGYHIDWRPITERMIRAASDIYEVAHAYVRTVARAHAIGEVRAHIDTHAALHGSDGLRQLVELMDLFSDPFYPKFPLPKPNRDSVERTCAAAARAFDPNLEPTVLGYTYEVEFISYGEKFARDYIGELMRK